jgi:hypothetical protein
VVVNGCRDQTAAVAVIAAAMRPQIVVVVVDAAIGKGGAVLEGFRHARGDKVLFADADGATGAESLVQLVAALDEFDVAIGSRRMAGSQLLRAQPLNRRLLGLAFATVVRECCGLRFTDTQCGAKALRGPIAKQLCEAVTELRWTFDVDLLVQALAMGASISERPVEWTDQPGSKLSVLPTLLEVLPSLRRIRVKSAAQRLTASVPFRGMPAVAAGEPALAAA